MTHPPVFDTPEACERAFYAAFAACDLDAMMQVWAERAPLLCIHPGGPPITARDELARSWGRIFGSTGGSTGGGAGGMARGIAGGIEFTLSHRRSLSDGALAVRYVHENIHHGPGLRDTAVVCATNVFVREDVGWKLCSHHASPGPPAAPGDGGVH